MLKIINPKKQKLHQASIDAFLDLLKVYQNFELSPRRKKNATFFVFENVQQGVYGGSVIYSQKIYDLKNGDILQGDESEFLGSFMTYHPHMQEFWMVRICFCFDANVSPDSVRTLELCKNFYDKIYKHILNFGHSKEMEFLPYSLFSFDTIEPPLHKEWPKNLSILRPGDMSGLHHGVLALTGKPFIPPLSRKSSKKNSVAAYKYGSFLYL